MNLRIAALVALVGALVADHTEASCRPITVDEAIDGSNLIAVGVLSDADVYKHDAVVFASGHLDVEVTLVAPTDHDRRSPRTVIATWVSKQGPSRCGEIDLRQWEGQRGLWFLHLRGDGIAEMDHTGRFLALSHQLLVCGNLRAFRDHAQTVNEREGLGRVIEFLAEECTRLSAQVEDP